MGDPSTHVIFYQGYWHLAILEHGHWVDTKDFSIICVETDSERVVTL